MSGINNWHRFSKVYDKTMGLLEGIVDNDVTECLSLKNKTVLEVGCGTGRLAIKISKSAKKVIAVDSCKELINIAKRKAINLDNIQFKNLSIENYKTCHENVDIIISTFVIHHLVDVENEINKFKNILKPGGQLIIIDVLEHRFVETCIFYFYYLKKYGIIKTCRLFKNTSRFSPFKNLYIKEFHRHVKNDIFLSYKEFKNMSLKNLDGCKIKRLYKIFGCVLWEK